MNINYIKEFEILKQGGIVVFPTDTAFGIGCRMDNEDSVQRLFKLRRRPEDKAVPVLVSSIKMAEEYVEDIPDDVRELMERYWPGGLTIILNCKSEKVPSSVRGGGETIGIRIPGNETIQKIIEALGVPILAPSANFSGEKTPYDLSEVDPELASLVDGVIDGECSLKQASTVIDCTVKPWKIVRQGAVKVEL